MNLKVIVLWQFYFSRNGIFLTDTGISVFLPFLKVLLFWMEWGKNRNTKYLKKTSNFNVRLIFLICSCQNIENWGFPVPLKVCSTSCSVRQCQCFFKSNFFWDIERLQCNYELDCPHKIRSHKKPSVAYSTKKVLKAQKDPYYLNISRGTLLACQAGKIVHSWINRLPISIFSSDYISSNSDSAFPVISV